MAYFLSPALVRLRSEVNALWPNRSKASDGWIGDTSHAARKSDHNPDYSAGGIVRAIDVTNDGINVDAFVSSVIRDVRTRYVITRGRIWTRESGWQAYSGPNGHYHHVHVSVRAVSGYDLQIHSWGLSTTVGNNLGGGGSVTTPNVPSAPAPIEEDELSAADVTAIRKDIATVHSTIINGVGAIRADLNTIHEAVKATPGVTAETVLRTKVPRQGGALTGDTTLAAWLAWVDTNTVKLLEAAGLPASLAGLSDADLAKVAAAVKAAAAEALEDGVNVNITTGREAS